MLSKRVGASKSGISFEIFARWFFEDVVDVEGMQPIRE
jgi:hypothetical protein